jgi:hypothetical protein
VGVVHVLYGSDTGVEASLGSDYELLEQGEGGVADSPEEGDWFGSALAAADFNADGYDDLAIGVHTEDIWSSGTRENAGAVHVLFGYASAGILGLDSVWLDQDQGAGNLGGVDEGDLFGIPLAAGDFNRDSYDDLAIGVPLEDVLYASNTITDAGAVVVVYGTSGYTMNVASGEFIHQGLSWVYGQPEPDDSFGWTLAIMPSVYGAYVPVVLRLE